VTSVIMAMMVEFAQRMLTKRPTVPRTSEIDICWAAARSPTRASEPRTEITSPKELTGTTWYVSNYPARTMQIVLAQTVKPAGRRTVQTRRILAQDAAGRRRAFAE